jgi:hypothetical protein
MKGLSKTMSDVQNPNETDEVNETDREAAEEFDVRDLGIDPVGTPISDLLKIYRENVEIVKAYAEKVKSGSTDPNDVGNQVKSNVKRTLKLEGVSDEVKATVGNLRSVAANVSEAVFNKTPATQGLLESAVMLEAMEELVSLMRDEYAYHYNKAVQAEKDRKGIKSTPSETAIRAKLACIKLKGTKPGEGLINARINMAKALGEDDSIPSDLFKTGGERNGFNTDVFPRLPRLDVEGTTSSKNTHLAFRWLAKDDPNATDPMTLNQTTLNDVAHDVISSGAYRVTGKDIERRLKAEKLGIGATKEEWSLTFETGTLYGKLA